MRLPALLVTIAAAALGGCESQPPQPQQTNLVNATRTDPVAPSAGLGNDVGAGSGTTAAPAPAAGQQSEQQGPPPQ